MLNEIMDIAAVKAKECLDKIDFRADDAAYDVLVLVTDLIAEKEFLERRIANLETMALQLMTLPDDKNP